MTSIKGEKKLPLPVEMAAAGFYNLVEAERYQRKLVEDFQAVMKSCFPTTFAALDWTGLSAFESDDARYIAVRAACGNIYHGLLHTLRVTVEVYKEAAKSGVARDAKLLVTLAALFHDYKHSLGRYSEEINIHNAMAPFVLTGAEAGIVIDGRFVSKADLCIDIYGTVDPTLIGCAYDDFMRSVAQIIGETYYPYRKTTRGGGSEIVRKADIAGMLRPDWYETTFLGLHGEFGFRDDESSVMRFIEQQQAFAQKELGYNSGEVLRRLQMVSTCMCGEAGWLMIRPENLRKFPIYDEVVDCAIINEQHYALLEGRAERNGSVYGQFTLAAGDVTELLLPPAIIDARPGDYIYFTEHGRLEDDQATAHRKVVRAVVASGMAGRPVSLPDPQSKEGEKQ